MATGNIDVSIAGEIHGSWRGRDGHAWTFCRTNDGPMVEVVKITRDGDVLVAPHATTDDLRSALHTLAVLYREHVGWPGITRDISIDVRV